MRNLRKFTFPKNIDSLKRVKNQQQLRQKLKNLELTDRELKTQIEYNYLITPKGKYLYAMCSKCQAGLSYILRMNKNKQIYMLHFIEVLHKHPQKNYQTFIQKIANDLEKLSNQGIVVSKEFFMEKYKISSQTYRQGRIKFQNDSKAKSFDFLQTQLKKLNYEIHYQSNYKDLNNKNIPQLLILTSSQMKQQYKKYGRCIFLDSSYNLCKDKPNYEIDKYINSYNSILTNIEKKQRRQYILTTICGLNGYHKVVVFGFAIALDSSEETIYKILKNFFKFHDEINTQTIVADLGINTVNAVLSLEKQNIISCELYSDLYHQIRNLVITGAAKRFILLQIFLAQSTFEYKKRLGQLKSLARKSQLKQIQKLQERAQFFCFSQAPKTFIHVDVKDSPCDKIRRIFLQKKLKPFEYNKLILKLIEIFSQINVKSHRKRLQQNKMPQFLQSCRKNIAHKVFDKILMQVQRTKYNTLIKDQNDQTKYIVVNDKFEQRTQVISDGDKLRCDCGYQQKALLPCSHVISVAIICGVDLLNCVDQFYKQ